jgi:hypothetical protein
MQTSRNGKIDLATNRISLQVNEKLTVKKVCLREAQALVELATLLVQEMRVSQESSSLMDHIPIHGKY